MCPLMALHSTVNYALLMFHTFTQGETEAYLIYGTGFFPANSTEAARPVKSDSSAETGGNAAGAHSIRKDI